MKKGLFLGVLGVLLFQFSFSKQISKTEALRVAQNHANAQMAEALKTTPRLQLQFTQTLKGAVDNAAYKNQSAINAYYIFDVVGLEGFVMVSADDLLYPVLGYSTEGDYSPENMPKALVKWLAEYEALLKDRINSNAEQEENLKKAWQEYATGNFPANKRKAAVSPLLKTTWSQSPYYNDKCPYDRFEFDYAVTGCVATAMAQVMNYWEYPAKGNGYHSYNHNRYGTLSANFGNTTYNWSSMPNSLNAKNDAVATLMYHCGVSVDMGYSVSSSGAYVIKQDASVCAESALEDYFGYDEDLRGVERSSYSGAQWVNLMKAELNGDRPVLYAGFGTGGGHAFVCDGYDNRDYFHMNWGWGGYQDGYFILDALNPNGTGTGGGNGGYNSGQQAIIGVMPPEGNTGGNPTEFDLRLYSYISAPSSVGFLDPLDVNVDIANYGKASFKGKIAAAIFDQNDQFVEFVEEYTETDLPINTHYTNGLDFSTDGLSAPPGTYKLAILYQPTGGSWTIVTEGNYSNYINLKIEGYANNMQLYRDIVLDPEQIIQNESFEIWFDIANMNSYSYTGKISADIHSLDGKHIETIDEIDVDDFCANCHYKDGLTIKSSGVSLDPGTYYLVLWELEDIASDWSIVGSEEKPNPIYFVVSEPGLKKDQYEDNNEVSSAYVYTPNFVNDKARFTTVGANIHNVDDDDYFSMKFDKGYNYAVKARVNDIYDSKDGKEYTMDVLFSYDKGNGWSESFDDQMPGSALFQNGGEIVFYVSPYFQGEAGTYSLDIEITRVLLTSAPETDLPLLSVWPNPANSVLNVSNLNELSNLVLIDAAGKQVLNENAKIGNAQLDVSQLQSGVYTLMISSNGAIRKEKVVISR